MPSTASRTLRRLANPPPCPPPAAPPADLHPSPPSSTSAPPLRPSTNHDIPAPRKPTVAPSAYRSRLTQRAEAVTGVRAANQTVAPNPHGQIEATTRRLPRAGGALHLPLRPPAGLHPSPHSSSSTSPLRHSAGLRRLGASPTRRRVLDSEQTADKS
ncbi:hypothetical protein PVAP13_5KG659407 [Panicum virgatum]|uniref:Uncharacterized protein n=1 Tax=Panicum virgatum TaxID=38727 RepID=A0A8T0SRM3_PANVG|nr:hypothetical protein PVAP13_5KG659407 [Panicum virgatum]